MFINDLIISENKTILEAIYQLDKAAKRILFVTNESKFVATLSDGDIRRWLLKKESFDLTLKTIANYNPKYLYEEEKWKTKDFMKTFQIDALPILNEKHEIVSIIFKDKKELRHKTLSDIPVVIMAGGLGTRLYPYTKILPKPLIPIGELPIAEHIINKFSNYGINKFFLVVNHKKNMVKAYFNEIEKNYEIFFVDEEKPLGTGGGLFYLKDKIDKTFILSNCDILIDDNYEKIYKYHKKNKNLITMVCSLKKLSIPYGVIEVGDKGNILKMKEKPNFTFYTNTGMYIVEPKVINELEENIPIGFPDIIQKYMDMGEKIGYYPIKEENWLDMGQIDEMEEMLKRLEENE